MRYSSGTGMGRRAWIYPVPVCRKVAARTLGHLLLQNKVFKAI